MSDDQLLNILSDISTSLSIIGCIIIGLAYLFWDDVRCRSRKILLYITIADFFTAVGYLALKTVCVLQSFVTTASSMMSFCWTCCLALYLHAISLNAQQEKARRIVYIFHFIAWPLPLLFTIIARAFGVLGASEDDATADWCWIRVKDCLNGSCEGRHAETVAWMLFTGKLWEIISYLVIFFAFLRIWCHVRKIHQPETTSSTRFLDRLRSIEIRILLIPVAYIFIRIWGTIRFIRFASGYPKSRLLDCFQAFGDGSQGFVNAVMFCIATEKVLDIFHRCCGKCCRRRCERSPSSATASLLQNSVHHNDYGTQE